MKKFIWYVLSKLDKLTKRQVRVTCNLCQGDRFFNTGDACARCRGRGYLVLKIWG